MFAVRGTMQYFSVCYMCILRMRPFFLLEIFKFLFVFNHVCWLVLVYPCFEIFERVNQN